MLTPADIQNYESILQLSLAGKMEKASEQLRLMRDEASGASGETSLLRTLVSSRISLTSDSSNVSLQLLEPNQTQDLYLKAELHFVRGLHYFHGEEFEAGGRDFIEAAKLFRKLGRKERELLAEFNAFIGDLNSGRYEETRSLTEALEMLTTFQRKATEVQDLKTLGLVLRQKSYFFQDLKRFRAAYAMAVSAAERLELYGTKADFQLGLVQAADCAIELGDPEKARMHLEFILDTDEARVLFPLAFVQMRLGSKGFDKNLELSSFSVVSPFWREKFEDLKSKNESQPLPPSVRTLIWDLNASRLALPHGVKIILKRNSLEGKLLRALMQKVSTKALLCEKLWPEHCESLHLDNRLHRLVNRLNAKVHDLVVFDGASYSLSRKIKERST